MMGNAGAVAQLLIPAIRWSDEHGFDKEREKIDLALKLGVGGFIFFGGKADSVKELILELRERSKVPLLIGADLERGAGQQFEGLTQLPPAAALGFLNDADVIRRAALITAAEARSLGINWIYAPMCDLDIEPNNPIVGTRSFGANANKVAELVSEWIDACQSSGVMACAKHFPGHGRTVRDSHAELPSVDVSENVLQESDLIPFQAAIDAGVAGVMTAHVAFPALDSSGAPATLSNPILHDLLRVKMGFDGIVVTDAFIMQGVLEAGSGGNKNSGAITSEQAAAVRAIEAGCDILLYPEDIAGVARVLGGVAGERIQGSLRRRERWAEWCTNGSDAGINLSNNLAWADQTAVKSVHLLNGTRQAPLSKDVDLITVDDDIGGPYPSPSRKALSQEMGDNGVDVTECHIPSLKPSRTVVIALYGDIRAWKGRAGYSDTSLKTVSRVCDAAYRAGQQAIIVQFSHPRLARQLPQNVPVLCAWGGEAIMQRAAARKLLQ